MVRKQKVNCGGCQKKFFRDNERQATCSVKCRKRVSRARRKEQQEYEAILYKNVEVTEGGPRQPRKRSPGSKRKKRSVKVTG